MFGAGLCREITVCAYTSTFLEHAYPQWYPYGAESPEDVAVCNAFERRYAHELEPIHSAERCNRNAAALTLIFVATEGGVYSGWKKADPVSSSSWFGGIARLLKPTERGNKYLENGIAQPHGLKEGDKEEVEDRWARLLGLKEDDKEAAVEGGIARPLALKADDKNVVNDGFARLLGLKEGDKEGAKSGLARLLALKDNREKDLNDEAESMFWIR